MARKRVRAAAAVGLAVGVVAAAFVLARPTPRLVTLEAFDRVERGMTEAEVAAVLGAPGVEATFRATALPEWYTSDDAPYSILIRAEGVSNPRYTHRMWRTETQYVFMDFEDGTTSGSYSAALIPPRFVDRVRARLGW